MPDYFANALTLGAPEDLEDATIQTRQAYTGSDGRERWQWAAVAGTVQVDLQPLSGPLLRSLPEGLREGSTHLAFVEDNANIVTGNRLLVDSRTYLIRHTERWDSHRRCVLQEMEAG